MNEQLKIIITAEIDGLKKEVNNAKKQISDLSDESGKSAGKISSSLKKIGAAAVAAFSVKAIVDFTKELVNCASTVAAEQSAYSQIMGNYADEATAKLRQVADETGITDTRLTAGMTSMTAKWKGLGFGIDEATTYASRGLTLAADASAFWDMSLDESTSHLNSFINGSYEGGEAIGLFANDTQMALYAVEQGLISDTKEWANLAEAQKQATRLDYAENMMKASGATGQAAKEAGAYANVQANLTEKWRQFKALIGEPILQNIVVPAMQLLTVAIDEASSAFEAIKNHVETFKTKISEAQTWVQEHSTTLTLIGIALGGITAAIIAYNAAAIAKAAVDAAETIAIWALIAAETAHSVASTVAAAATTAFGAAMAFLTSPITLVILAITAVIAIIVLCVKHWDEIKAKVLEVADAIKEKVSEMKEKVVEFFTNLKDQIVEIIENIKSSVIEKWNAIKEFFSTIVQAIVTLVTTGFNNAKTNIENAINLIKSVVNTVFNGIKTIITTITNGIKTHIQNVFGLIKGIFTGDLGLIKSSVSNIFNNIKSTISSVMNTASNTVKTAINKIKGFMNFSWSLPKLKMPKISITGKFSLNPPSTPKFSISWHQFGGVFDNPTLFPWAGGIGGLGENGAEAIVPLEKNTQWLDRIASMLNEKMGGGTPVILQVDGKTFAQTCISTMNDLTRQTGTLPLKLV